MVCQKTCNSRTALGNYYTQPSLSCAIFQKPYHSSNKLGKYYHNHHRGARRRKTHNDSWYSASLSQANNRSWEGKDKAEKERGKSNKTKA